MGFGTREHDGMFDHRSGRGQAGGPRALRLGTNGWARGMDVVTLTMVRVVWQ